MVCSIQLRVVQSVSSGMVGSQEPSTQPEITQNIDISKWEALNPVKFWMHHDYFIMCRQILYIHTNLVILYLDVHSFTHIMIK